MAQRQVPETMAGYFSPELTSEFQAFFKDEFGRNVKRLDAQQLALRIAEFVLLKEVRNNPATIQTL